MPDFDIEDAMYISGVNMDDNSKAWTPMAMMPVAWLRDLSQVVSRYAIKAESMAEAIGNG